MPATVVVCVKILKIDKYPGVDLLMDVSFIIYLGRLMVILLLKGQFFCRGMRNYKIVKGKGECGNDKGRNKIRVQDTVKANPVAEDGDEFRIIGHA